MTDDDDAVLRTMIQHEDALRDQRLGWLLALNGFLFAALGFAWSDSDSTSLVLIVSAVGIVVALSTAAAMYASELAIKRLRAWSRGDATSASREGLPLVGLRRMNSGRAGASRRLCRCCTHGGSFPGVSLQHGSQ